MGEVVGEVLDLSDARLARLMLEGCATPAGQDRLACSGVDHTVVKPWLVRGSMP